MARSPFAIIIRSLLGWLSDDLHRRCGLRSGVDSRYVNMADGVISCKRGQEAIAGGDEAMKVKEDYETAHAYYKSACDVLPNAPPSQSLYGEALGKYSDSGVKLAEQYIAQRRSLRRRAKHAGDGPRRSL